MAETDKNLEDMTLEELQTHHSDMLATASDLGMNVDETFAREFSDTDEGLRIIEGLDGAIQKFREGLDEGGGSSQSQEGLAQQDEGVVGDQVGDSNDGEKKPSSRSSNSKPKKGKTVAKKAVAKKTAKKAAPAKKAAKKSEGKTPSDRLAGTIKVLKTDNPSKGGKGERIAKILKSDGKTVESVVKGGAKLSSINTMVKMGLIKIVK